jgi:hypothetical protein
MTANISTPPLSDQQVEQNGAGAAITAPARARATSSGRKAAIFGILIAAVIVAALAGAVYLLLQNPPLTANIRDIVIIIAALVLITVSVTTSLLLILLLYRLQALTQLLRSELIPILMDTQRAARTVYGTTVFISKNVAQPTIKVASFAARFRRMAQVIGKKMHAK